MNRTNLRLPSRFLTITLSLAVVGLSACGGDEHDHDHDHDHEGGALAGTLSHICGHFAGGPFESVTSSLDQEMGPEATFPHTRVNIGLQATQGGNGGWVHIDSSEEAELVFGVSSNVDLMIVRHSDDSSVAPEQTVTDTECAEMAVAHVVDLEAGRYDLYFGPTDATEVGWGFEEMEHDDHDHDHDHDDG